MNGRVYGKTGKERDCMEDISITVRMMLKCAVLK